VQPYRLQHGIAEMSAEKMQRAVLVAVVYAAYGGILSQIVQKVAQVMKEAGGDERGIRPFDFGQFGALKGVLKLVDALGSVAAPAGQLEEIQYRFQFGRRLHANSHPAVPT
jgi:hypothetical protein